ncbi:hypothetical protein F3K43_13930 [Streptomyces sp. LBUM 1476]|nr:hypothetical protein [Streptomyces sp. LBUM 1476]GAQ57770.1 hypothetical protein a10_07644 [Streptomyces acidiscabies]
MRGVVSERQGVWLRRVGVGGFVAGVVVGVAFFAFFPGLPHVIDWGAVIVSLGVGVLVRWGCLVWGRKKVSGAEGSRP